MVPINFYQYRAELRRSLLTRLESLSNDWDPFNAAWICYALSSEGIENNQELMELHNRMLRWLEEEKDNLWEVQRNLGPVAAVIWLCKKMDLEEKPDIVATLGEKVKQLSADDKWSPLRDPEQVYLLALDLQFGSETVRNHLKNIARQETQRGPLRRRILYAAVLRELGESITLPQGEPQDEGDFVALVWWAERYDGDKHIYWERFNSVKDRIALDEESGSGIHRILTVPEIAMLYEAVVRETLYSDPILLFEYFPLHPRIKEITKDYFKNGEYAIAIFEATIALNDEIQQRTGITNKKEAELVQATMKNISDPSRLLIRFNDYLDSETGKSEQAGLALICEGVFKAFRNPKAHKLKDHPVIQRVQSDAYEALEVLIIISYLMKRIETARITDKG